MINIFMFYIFLLFLASAFDIRAMSSALSSPGIICVY